MKKLSKVQVKARGDLLNRLEAAGGAVRDAVEEFNTSLEERWAAEVVPVLEAFNAILEETQEFASDVGSEARGYMEERSEAWLEGTAGEAYSTWTDEWEGYYAEPLDTETVPDLPETPDVDDAFSRFEELTEEPGR